MNKSIVVVAAVLAISGLSLACAEAARIAPAPTVLPSPPGLPEVTSAEAAQLREMWVQLNTLVDITTSSGQYVPDGAYAAIAAVEDAQRTLQGLDETRQLLAANMGYQVYTGQIDITEMEAALGIIDTARHEVLARVSLAE